MKTSSDAGQGAETATERLQVEVERLRSELDACSTRLHLTEKLLANVPDAVFVADSAGRIIDVNSAACSLLGYERGELLKIQPWDFATRASWEELLTLIGTMPLGHPFTVQRAYRCKSGETLSNREIEVLKLMAQGKSNKEIGAALFISEGTVKSHGKAIFAKMNVASRTEAVAEATRRGLIRL
jgi:PAS domain S-box-containing protein